MKSLGIFLFLALLLSDSTAQYPRKWTRLRGPNVGFSNNAPQLYWGFDGEIIALSNLNGYDFSSDDGNTWNFRPIFANYPKFLGGYYTEKGLVLLPSGEYYYYLGAQNFSGDPAAGVYHSTDFGKTWKQLLSKKDVQYLVVGTDNSLLIVVRSENNISEIYKSIDDGKSWTQLSGNFGGTIVAATKKYAFFLDNYGFFRYDYATNQSMVDTNGLGYFNTYNLRGTFQADEMHLLIWTDSLIFSGDGVNGWTQNSNLQHIGSMVKGNGNNILAQVYDGGNIGIFSSSDFGQSWNMIDTFASTEYQSFAYSNPDKLLGENSNALYISRDHANSWQEIGFPFAQIGQVQLSDQGEIFALLYNGYASLSTDKGNSWQQTYYISIFGKGINDSIIGISQNGIFVFQSDTLKLRSVIDNLVNGGWTSFPTALASDHQKYIYISHGTDIYRSDDNGITWINVDAPDDGNPITAMDASSDGTLYYGTHPVIYRSYDHGGSWTKLLPFPDPVEITCLKTFGTSNVLIGTNGKGVLLSSDKGNSWSRIDGNNIDYVTSIAIDSKGAIAAGISYGLWIRDAVSQNWSKVSFGGIDSIAIGGIDVAANDDFYVGTSGSSVWVGTLNYNGVHRANTLSGAMQLFPNPASENVTARFEPNAEAALEIFDMLGRKISALPAASGETNINTSNLADGIYTVVLARGKTSSAEKLVVHH